MITKNDVIKYRKSILKEFYIEKNSKNIFFALRNFSLKDNLIISTIDDYSIIKICASNLILNEYNKVGFFQYLSLTTKDLLTNYFDKAGIDFERPEYLILYEISDIPNKSYPDLLNELIQVRLMNDKYTTIIFTNVIKIEGKGLIDYITENSIKYYKKIFIDKFNNAICNNVIQNGNMTKIKRKHIL